MAATSDPDRFERFMASHENRVYGLARRLTGQAAEAEDVAQQVFLRAWEHFPTLDGNPSAWAWLRTTTTRLCLNHLQRYRWRWRFFSELGRPGEESEEGERDFAAAVPDTAAADPGTSRVDLIEQALDRLPSAQRLPLILFYFEGMTYDQISRHLGISLPKLKTDLLRGRARLKAVLERMLPKEGGCA